MSELAELGFDDLLVPVDGSDHAADALSYALALATGTGARVHVCSVVNPYTLSKVTDLREAREGAEEVVADAERRVEAAGLDAVTAVREGSPADAIREYAEEAGVDCVVMSTHGRSGVERYLIGSVTEKVVRTSPVPVLAVHTTDADGGREGEYRRLLLPTDGSAAAAAAERTAVAFASAFDATLDVVSVVDSTDLATAAGPTGAEGEAVRQVEKALDARAARATDAVADDARAAGVDVETSVEQGSVHERILARATETDADAIVVGTHGRGGVERYLLGSVAEKVVRLADRPVLVVPADAADVEGEGASDAGT
ncbi:universal stress protein [Candidatus Halobonum tyrrellensis]|uniref:UspA domain-containing protein n=1 Tax=Candidatus Halobonum tyrrellensis G22 TaxID=1324957 RepID=V4IXJ3_9EURY|nr:universal stress protein [Candidatus Halobonum tyrrellensis]ESP87877.1 UspA domain-containing protein [Candidatus Halobonum tyrrellensis G22]